MAMRFSLVRKFTIGISLVACVTYGISAGFIFVLKPWIAPNLSSWAYICIILSLGVVWTGILGYLAARWLAGSLTAIARAAREAASGNLLVEVPMPKSKDELQLLGESFGGMVGSLKEMIRTVIGDAQAASDGAASLSDALAYAAKQVETTSEAVDRIHRAVKEQDSSVEDAVQGAERMREETRRIRSEAQRARDVSGMMERTMNETDKTMEELIRGMARFAAAGDETYETVKRLGDDAAEIESITMAVRDIGEQTHLLALNASIEAARAGEAGAGFSVVAQEIRKLAERSERSVRRIDDMIRSVQLRVREAALLLESQSAAILEESSRRERVQADASQLSSGVASSIEAMRQMESAVEAQSEEVERICRRIEDISARAGRISEGAGQIAGASMEQSAVIQQIASSAEMLQMQSARVLERTRPFRT